MQKKKSKRSVDLHILCIIVLLGNKSTVGSNTSITVTDLQMTTVVVFNFFFYIAMQYNHAH